MVKNASKLLKEQEIKSIDSALNRYTEYDNNIKSISNELNKIKDLIILRNNPDKNNEDINNINIEILGSKNVISNLMESKIHGEKIYNIDTFLLIGDNIKTERSFHSDFLDYNNISLTEHIDTLVNGGVSDDTDLNLISNIIENTNLKRTEIGVKSYGIQQIKSVYEDNLISEEDFFNKRNKILETVDKLNQLKNNYESMSLLISKLSDLSLVKYM